MGILSQQQIDKERRTDRGGDDADGQLAGIQGRACHQIGGQQQGPATERRGGQQEALITAATEPQQMGHHQPDKTDDAAQGYRQSGEQADRQHQPHPHLVHIQPHQASLGLPQQQLLQHLALAAEPEQGERQQQPPPAKLLAAIGEAAHHPEHELAQRAVVGKIEQPGHGGIGENTDGNAKQQQSGMAEPGAPRQPNEQHGHQQGTTKGCQRQPPAGQIDAKRLGHRHRHHGGQSGSTRHAKQTGFGHRVVQHHLQHGAATGESRPCQQGQQGTRQTQLQQNALLKFPQRLPGQQHKFTPGEGEEKKQQGQQQEAKQPAPLPALLTRNK